MFKQPINLGAFGEVRRAIEDELAEALRLQAHWTERVEECQDGLRHVDQVCGLIGRLPGRIISRFSAVQQPKNALHEIAPESPEPIKAVAAPEPERVIEVQADKSDPWYKRCASSPELQREVLSAVEAGFSDTKSIAQITGKSPSSVYNALAWLKETGRVTATRGAGQGGPVSYTVAKAHRETAA